MTGDLYTLVFSKRVCTLAPLLNERTSAANTRTPPSFILPVYSRVLMSRHQTKYTSYVFLIHAKLKTAPDQTTKYPTIGSFSKDIRSKRVWR